MSPNQWIGNDCYYITLIISYAFSFMYTYVGKPLTLYIMLTSIMLKAFKDFNSQNYSNIISLGLITSYIWLLAS